MWGLELPPKVKIFSWRVFNDYIPMEMNLKVHHVPVYGICGWCKKDWSTTAHSLLYCDKIRERWKAFSFWNLLKDWQSLSIREIGERMFTVIRHEDFEFFLMGMWNVWRDLCKAKHERRPFKYTDLWRVCEAQILNFKEAKIKLAWRNRLLPNEGESTWRRPATGNYRLDVDFGDGSIGGIVRNSDGEIVAAMAKPVNYTATVLEGELKAILYGICMCNDLEISPIEVFTDSMLAVCLIRNEEINNSVMCDELVESIRAIKKNCVTSIKHMRREANTAAHALAEFGKNLSDSFVWRDNWPTWLIDLVSRDLN